MSPDEIDQHKKKPRLCGGVIDFPGMFFLFFRVCSTMKGD
jgi:hypothetical protein